MPMQVVFDVCSVFGFKVMELLLKHGSKIEYHDPYVDEIPKTREHMEFCGMKSVELTKDNLQQFDAVVIVTDHDDLDYKMIAEHSNLIVDARNALKSRGLDGADVVSA